MNHSISFRTIRHSVCLFVLLVLISTAGTATAQSVSIFSRCNPDNLNPIQDVKARTKGDLLYIVVREQSDVENLDLRQMRKSGSSKSEGQTSYALGGGFGTGAANGTIDQETSGSRQFDGNTQFRSEREYLDQMAVRVIDTTQNGNMIIGGVRYVTLEGDTRRLIVTGLVRKVDVSAQNSIQSNQISDLRISYESSGNAGAERKFLNQGWLGRKVNKWWW